MDQCVLISCVFVPLDVPVAVLLRVEVKNLSENLFSILDINNVF